MWDTTNNKAIRIACAVLLTLAVGTRVASAQIAFVNVSAGVSADELGTSISTSSASLTSGNLLVLLVAANSTSVTITSIADTAGNTYFTCSGSRQTALGMSEIFYAPNVTGHAANVVTVTFSASVDWRTVVALQYSGAATSSTCETAAIGSAASASSVTSASFSPAASGNVNAAIVSANAPGAWTPGTNYTLRHDANGPPDRLSQDRLNAPAGSQTASATFESTTAMAISVASFKPATTKPKRMLLLGIGADQ